MMFLDKFSKKTVWSAFIVLIALIIGIGVRYVLPRLKHDNFIEEASEKVIKDETGYDTDLTPNSPE